MLVGVGIPNCREGKVYPPGFVSAESLTKIARAAEEAGLSSLWANDLQSTFDEELAKEGRVPPNFFEVLTTMSFVLARTERLRVLTSAITVPLRDPVLLAKQAATLDVLSGGRFSLGLGLGGKRTELDRLRGRFSKQLNRGRWLDESLALMTALFAEPTVTFEGEYFSVQGAEVYPKPTQQRFPIYLTGAGDEMLKRTAKWASGWIHMHISPEELAARLGVLRQACDTAGTDYSKIEICVQFDMLLAATKDEAERRWGSSRAHALGAARGRSAETSFIIGSPSDLIQRVRLYEKAGLQHLGCILTGETPAEVIDQIGLLGEHVVPELAA
jgi:probable F420-dependent oxidoreductase